MEPEDSSPYSQVPATCPYPESTRPFSCCVIPPLETLPPGDPSGGVVYLRIVSRGIISPCEYFLTGVFHGEALLAPRPTPQAGGPPLVGCPRLLIQYIRSYPPYRRLFLHPQPEDAPCRGDRDTVIHRISYYTQT